MICRLSVSHLFLVFISVYWLRIVREKAVKFNGGAGGGEGGGGRQGGCDLTGINYKHPLQPSFEQTVVRRSVVEHLRFASCRAAEAKSPSLASVPAQTNR